ncbi:MAG: hypothetical protein V1694_02320 [Candidatus Eisenbacteria bacterium]
MNKVLLAACLVLLVWASAAPAIVVEAESFVASYNAGGDPIYVVDCSGASGGKAVEGFDTTGDWIEVILNVPEAYGYVDSVRSAGYLNEQTDLASTVFGAAPGGGDVISAYHLVGLGIG